MELHDSPCWSINLRNPDVIGKLFLDNHLDNTLWGGILGEDGKDGIKVGMGDPVSEAFLDFQHKIKSLKERGILLAVCSKNNESDVRELFEKRIGMPLTLNDFSAIKINWDHKHVNLKRIAQYLNIGTEGLVFIDDNQVECDLVRQMLPEVRTIQLPKNPENIPDVLNSLIDFEKIVILKYDLNKTQQYAHKKKRDEFKAAVGNLKNYLQSLETEIWIRPATNEYLERVHQLFCKTNQFNVTTKRYVPADIQKFHADDHYELGIVSARDRFGDLGIIGLYLLDIYDSEVEIDSFILSCRAMGRGIESAILNQIKKKFVYSERKTLLARYQPTIKNIPAKTFFEQQNFDITVEKPDGEKCYSLSSDKCEQIECSWIKLIEKW